MTDRLPDAMNAWLRKSGPVLAPILLAVLVAALLLLASGVNPFEGFRLLWTGSLGTADKIPDTLITWVPLTLAAAGLVVTFAAGLWNIGIEGQIVVGAIAATWVAREIPGPGWVVMRPSDLARFGHLIATQGIWSGDALIGAQWLRNHSGCGRAVAYY